MELALVFGLAPLLVVRFVPTLAWGLVLWSIVGAAYLRLRSRRASAEVARPEQGPAPWGRIFRRFALSAVLLTALVAIRWPDRLFEFPRDRPWLWLIVILLYPPLSAFPQEYLYRTYFFRRFAPLFSGPVAMMLASGIAFGWVHVIFENAYAPLLTLVGGFFFADTYRRTGSLLVTCIEHSLYGGLIFTVGFGRYFVHGAMRV